MHLHSTPKYEVAVELLDWALQAFLSGSGYYAALHLAGAAEEVLAVYLRAPQHRLTPASDNFASLFVRLSAPETAQDAAALSKWAVDRMNAPRNSVKHKRGHADDAVMFDAVEEAADAIDRAVSNYFQLLGKLPLKHLPAIEAFDRCRRDSHQDEPGRS